MTLRPLWRACAVLALAASTALSRPLRFRVGVDAGGLERRASPVTVRLAAGKELGADDLRRLHPFAAAWVEPEGSPDTRRVVQADLVDGPGGVPAAVEVSWVEPRIAAGAWVSRVLTLESASAGSGTGFRFATSEGARDLKDGDRPVWRCDLGEELLRASGPAEAFRLYALDGRRFIAAAELDLPGRRPGRRVLLPDRDRAGPVLARTAATAEWTGAWTARATLDVTTWRAGEGEDIHDLALAVVPATDARATLLFRAAGEVAGRKDAELLLPQAGPGAACAWTAACLDVAGRSYTVCVAAHPGNPGPPACTAGADGLLGVNAPDTAVPVLRWRVRVRPERMDVAWAALVAADYATPPLTAVERLP